MFIHYNIYRTGKRKDEIIDSGKLQYNLQNDSDILILREIIYKLLNQYTTELPEVKKYGTGYIGKIEILYIEITDDDNITTPKEAFNIYHDVELKDLLFKWSKTAQEQQQDVKLEYKGNTVETIKDDDNVQKHKGSKSKSGKTNSKSTRRKNNS